MLVLKPSAAALTFAIVLADTALAHSGHGQSGAVSAGVGHYFSGVDHVAASIAAGVLTALLSRSAAGMIIAAAFFSAALAVYHKHVFFGGHAGFGFDAGFMAPALLVMAGACVVARNLFARRNILGRVRR